MSEEKQTMEKTKETENNQPEETSKEETSKEETTETTETTETKSEVEVQLEKAQADFSEMEDKFLRAQAEIANMSRRNKTEREQLARYRSQDLGKGILGSLDNLERALSIEVKTEEGTSMKKGVEMVLEGLRHALKEEGITEIPALGETFDPNLHQAVQTIPADDDHPADTIVDVLQKGYQLHERVLRPTMVIVAQ